VREGRKGGKLMTAPTSITRRSPPGTSSMRLTQAVLCASGFRTASILTVAQQELAVEREYEGGRCLLRTLDRKSTTS
jgi:hypothetical protein